MGGVDLVDQSLTYYSILRKTNRWTFKFSMHLILMFYTRNTNKQKEILSHMEFNFKTIDWFVQWEDIDSVKVNCKDEDQEKINNTNKTWNNKSKFRNLDKNLFCLNTTMHILTILYKKKTCALCYKNKNSFQTLFYCVECKKGFCIDTKRLCWFVIHVEIDEESSNINA